MSGILEVDLLEKKVVEIEHRVDVIEPVVRKLEFALFGGNGAPGLYEKMSRLEIGVLILMSLGLLNLILMSFVVFQLSVK